MLELILVVKMDKKARQYFLHGERFERVLRIFVALTGIMWVVGIVGFNFMLMLDAVDLTLLVTMTAPIVQYVTIATLVCGVVLLVAMWRKPVEP